MSQGTRHFIWIAMSIKTKKNELAHVSGLIANIEI